MKTAYSKHQKTPEEMQANQLYGAGSRVDWKVPGRQHPRCRRCGVTLSIFERSVCVSCDNEWRIWREQNARWARQQRLYGTVFIIITAVLFALTLWRMLW